MRRAVLLLAAGLLLAGCGGSAKTAKPVTLTQHVTQTVGDKKDPLAKRAVPPPLLLRAPAGVQRAVQGSSCVEYTLPSGEGTGRCANAPFPEPTRVTVVRPGQRVRLELAGARGFVVTVHPLGCDQQTLQQLRVPADGRWQVSLRPGTYTLFVGVPLFKIGRRNGNASGGLGLWVSRGHRLGVVRASSAPTHVC